MKKNVAVVLSAVVTAAVLGSCTDPKGAGEEHFIKVDDAELSFLADDSRSVTVGVRAYPAEWSVESDASWIRYTESEGAVTITVAPNTGDAERKGVITVTAGQARQEIGIWQLGQSGFDGARYRLLDDLYGNCVISPNGRYAGGYYLDYDENDHTIYFPVIIDIATDERVVFGPFPKSMFSFSDAMAITSQGTLFLDDGVGGGVVGFTLDGDYFSTEVAPGFKSRTVITGSSLDGSVMVGYGTGSPEGHTYGPVKVVDGEYRPLPLPELNYRDMPHDQGILAFGISADGTVIYGSTWDNLDAGMVYWDKEGNVHHVGEDVRDVREVTMVDALGEEYQYNLCDGVMTWAGAGNASPSGRWLAGTFCTETLSEDRREVYTSYCPAFFNTETKTTVIFDELGGFGGSAVTDDGIGFVGSTDGMASCRVVDVNTGVQLYGSLAEWVRAEFDIVIPGGALMYICPDGRSFMGTSLTTGIGGAENIFWYVADPNEQCRKRVHAPVRRRAVKSAGPERPADFFCRTGTSFRKAVSGSRLKTGACREGGISF